MKQQTPLNKQWVKEEIIKIRKYFEIKKTKTQYQNLWDAMKALLRENVTVYTPIL